MLAFEISSSGNYAIMSESFFEINEYYSYAGNKFNGVGKGKNGLNYCDQWSYIK